MSYQLPIDKKLHLPITKHVIHLRVICAAMTAPGLWTVTAERQLARNGDKVVYLPEMNLGQALSFLEVVSLYSPGVTKGTTPSA